MLAALQRYLYSLDETPGPRDVAALVARYCPPETRRLPTHHDELEADAAPEATRPRPGTASPAPTTAAAPPRPGPATAVIPRDGAAPRGKRGSRARTETFATHVELEHLLEGAAPGAGTAGETPDERSTAPADPSRPIDRPERPPLQLPGRAAPTTSLLVLAALGALVLGGAAIFVFYQGRASVMRPDAAPRRDAALAPPDAAASSSAVPPADAPTGDAALPVDAAPPLLPPTRDAGPPAPHHDAAPHPPRPDGREPGEPASPPGATPAAAPPGPPR